METQWRMSQASDTAAARDHRRTDDGVVSHVPAVARLADATVATIAVDRPVPRSSESGRHVNDDLVKTGHAGIRTAIRVPILNFAFAIGCPRNDCVVSRSLRLPATARAPKRPRQIASGIIHFGFGPLLAIIKTNLHPRDAAVSS